ncbi:MAG: DUF4388 domain-containing protein [Pseudanabaenaceae cyanobacterium SKYGB_i_bin29]|nr:DUF4388 domain-containing protein [Pseudanabaenaceae cyanobacterium SKYG29]MDW8421677.1 DUF4388 domain-containing protein [Pseudanabaenaceae cyanobacterium SKYGB_i_bin29]
MGISGYLSEFSLAEVFRLLEQGKKTGCLRIRPILGSASFSVCQIFFKQGYVVTAKTNNSVSLPAMIEKNGWLRPSTIQRLVDVCSSSPYLGICLKERSVLSHQQLEVLFKQQVLTPIPQLFTLSEGWFEFEENHLLPLNDITGLLASPMDIALVGLRILKDWTPLMDKLPQPQSNLMPLVKGKPPYRLSAQEWRVWEQIDGHSSSKQISANLGLEVVEVQKIVFRLIVIGLVEEMETVSVIPEEESLALTEQDEIPSSFLDGLLSFLRSKA